MKIYYQTFARNINLIFLYGFPFLVFFFFLSLSPLPFFGIFYSWTSTMVNFNLIKLFPSAETGRIFVPFSTSNLSRTKLTVFSKYFTGAVILTNDFNSDSMLPRARQNVAEIFVPFRAPSPPLSSTNRHFSTSMPHHGCSSRPRNAFPRCVCVCVDHVSCFLKLFQKRLWSRQWLYSCASSPF